MGEPNLIQCGSREAWLDERPALNRPRPVVTASALGTYLESPLLGYATLRGMVETDIEQTAAMALGLDMERDIAERFAYKVGTIIEPAPPHSYYQHPDNPGFLVSLDFWALNPATAALAPLETKKVNNFTKFLYAQGGAPTKHDVQTQAQLCVLGVPLGYLFAMNSDSAATQLWMRRNARGQSSEYPPEEFALTTHAHAEFQSELMEFVVDLIERARTGNEPDADGTELSRRALKALHPKDNGEILIGNDEAESDIRTLESLKAQLESVDASYEIAKQRLFQIIGDYSEIKAGAYHYTYKHANRRGNHTVAYELAAALTAAGILYETTEPSTYRTLRKVEPKKDKKTNGD